MAYKNLKVVRSTVKKESSKKTTHEKLMKISSKITKEKYQEKEKPIVKTRTTKRYTALQIQAVTQMKAAFPDASIRDLAKMGNIPKSVIQRWLKNPSLSIQKEEIKEVKKSIKETKTYGKIRKKSAKEVKNTLNRLLAKIILDNRENKKMGNLRIKSSDDPRGYEVIS